MNRKRNRTMPTSNLLTSIARKGANKETIAQKVIRQPKLLPEVLAGLDAEKPAVKYGCASVLRFVSEKQPALLAPQLDRFIELLDCENTFLKWGAILIVGNLAGVDSKKRIERILDKFLQPIREPVMVTAACVIGSAARIALARPALADKIATEILKVDTAKYQTDECRNVALGHAIKALDQFFDHINDKQTVIEFVRRQLNNSRNATRRKAAEFLKKRRIEPRPRNGASSERR